jgi:hypothetical protein
VEKVGRFFGSLLAFDNLASNVAVILLSSTLEHTTATNPLSLLLLGTPFVRCKLVSVRTRVLSFL